MEGTRLATVDDLSILEEFVSLAVGEQVENRGGWVWSRRETRNPPPRQILSTSRKRLCPCYQVCTLVRLGRRGQHTQGLAHPQPSTLRR